jgi:hypothetical protein
MVPTPQHPYVCPSDGLPDNSSYGYDCSAGGPSLIRACVVLNYPIIDGLDCCDGSDADGNGYVDEGACDPAGAIACFGIGWCGVGGHCVGGRCI